MTEYMLPCLMKTFFRIPCPGCGGQRAVYFLLHGDFAKAFWMYPAIYPLLTLAGLIVGNYFFPFKRYSQLSTVFSIISVAMILINYGFELNHIFNFV